MGWREGERWKVKGRGDVESEGGRRRKERGPREEVEG